MTLPPMSAEQANVVHYLESTEENVFITGKAGTGKTHVLRHFQESTRKKIAVCAPTGIAALNASGSTLHNLIGLGTALPADKTVDFYKIRSQKKSLLELDAIVIDEVSMVSSDTMDSVDRMLRFIRQNNDPFGGLQIIMFGDIYQLPPVVNKESKQYYKDLDYKSEWFFDAFVWQDAEFTTFALDQVHRQADSTFIGLLNGVRDGSISPKDLALLNALGRRPGKTNKAILLGTRRDIVKAHNARNLNKLKGKRNTYKARVNSGFGHMEPADREIYLKPQARIMMLSNDRQDRWVNGTQGIVENCGEGFVQVRLDDDMVHTVDRFAWVKAGTAPEDYKDAPKFHQIPMKLAWGITIHKSQGLSLAEIDIDLGAGSFSPGQTYVALSRATTPEGLYLSSPINRSDIRVDPNVQRFFESL